LKIVIPLVLVFGAIPFYAEWYGQQSLNSRYCADIDGALTRLAHIVTDEHPAGDGVRRAYLISAKLLYLVPRQPDEALADYLARVRRRLEELCRQ